MLRTDGGVTGGWGSVLQIKKVRREKQRKDGSKGKDSEGREWEGLGMVDTCR